MCCPLITMFISPGRGIMWGAMLAAIGTSLVEKHHHTLCRALCLPVQEGLGCSV